MPLYEYECVTCGHRTEVIQRIGAPPIGACPECSGEMKRLLSAPAFQFKGTGWYVTDYARKDKSPADGSKSKPKSTKSDDKKTSSESSSSSATPSSSKQTD